MKPFDDTIPEENIQPYQDLTTLLRQAKPRAAFSPEEQSEMLVRVRARLHQMDEVVFEEKSSELENLASNFQPRRKVTRRFSRTSRTLNMIAAFLVIGVIAGAAFFLFFLTAGE